MKTPLAPHITEKAYTFISEEKGATNHYTFKVAKTLRKEAIKAMIEREFKVHVTNIRTINLPGKVRIFKGKAGHTQATKKAIVRLKAGEKISAFDIKSTEESK